MEFELTPEAIDAWNRAVLEIERRSEVMTRAMGLHWSRPDPKTDEGPAAHPGEGERRG